MRINKKIRDKHPWLARPDILDFELQMVVNEAQFWLLVQSSILYGLMTGDPNNINADKCLEIIEHGKKNGVFPEKNYISPDFKLQS